MNFKLIWAMILMLVVYIGYLMRKEVVVPMLQIENPIIADFATSTEEVVTARSTPN